MELAQRMGNFGSNVFAAMDQAKAIARRNGQTIIDLSLGSADLPASPVAITAIQRALQEPQTHGYLLHQGTLPFRQAIARFYQRRYQVTLDPETEVLPLIGSQEGTAHLPLAVLDPQDYALLLDPGYPSHVGGVFLAGGQVHTMALRAEHQFLPVFSEVPPSICDRAKLMVLNYPHNPTTALAPLEFFQEAVDFCDRHGIVLAHDFPYNDIFYGDVGAPPSVLQVAGGKNLAIEFGTFSKSYNMGGFRIGFAVGNRDLIGALGRLKSIIDFNQYLGILQGAIAALDHDTDTVKTTVATYEQRRDVFIENLRAIGWDVPTPEATMYLWAPLPAPWQQQGADFCRELVQATGVAASPGSGFGAGGEGYVRFALVQPPEVLAIAAQKIASFL